MTPATETARELLDAAYADLDFADGDLVVATERPTPANESVWVDKGEWLALGEQVGAEKIFFVENNPVIVFAEYGAQEGPEQWLRYFNRVWCMGRPQLLFLARDGELTVFNHTNKPAKERDDKSRGERLLATVTAAAQVQQELQQYRRDQIESGQLFEDERFGYDDWADRALIRDLKKVRKDLLDAGLKVEHAHALIGRSIFIRYLEDRKVLIPEYFQSIAEEAGRGDWAELLTHIPPDAYLPEDERPVYPRVLADKDLTYALFERLAKDFNGDMFPISDTERNAVTSEHLELLQRLLLGGADDSLFFFAYRFDIIPIELISSIYEEFHSVERGKAEKHGSFYTPSSLVEFVLSNTLKDEVLNRRPRVMDPACGSGIFLVETFRRLVRHRMRQVRRRLQPNELREILREQIAGIDINGEAVRVAAFSLYLALLHYHDRRDISLHKLPSLTYDKGREETDPNQHFDVLVACNAFRIDEAIRHEDVRSRFGPGSADIVVGNPPWGELKGKDPLVAASKRGAMAWCKEHKRTVGDGESSQAFIHRTLDILRDGGRAGLLVSTGVFFRRSRTSREFRRQWLEAVALEHVVNFAAVRDTFFSGPSHKEGSIAPFASVIFEKGRSARNQRFPYWSAKKTAFIERVQVVILSRADVRIVRQDKMLADDELWEVYWWGSHRDEALIEALRLNPTLRDVVGPDTKERKLIAQGFKEAKKDKDPSGWLAEFKELPVECLRSYGELDESVFVRVPAEVHRKGIRTVFEGTRLLIRRGIAQQANANGRIIARLASEPFCFRHSIHGVRLLDHIAGDAEVLLGIAWSSIIRYYVFMTSGSWGMWHDEMHQSVISKIPVRIPTDTRLRSRITDAVSALRSLDPEKVGLFHPDGRSQEEVDESISRLEDKLNAAIFDLFDLDDAERELVSDLCNVGLDLFYRGMESPALDPVLTKPGSFVGRRNDLKRTVGNSRELGGYIDAFLDVWDRELARAGGLFRWWAIRPDDVSPMLAVVFSTEAADVPLPDPSQSLEEAWHAVLRLLGNASLQPYHARRVFIDGMVRVVAETDIILIKRNERRLWTRSAAREDAEATLHQLIRRHHAVRPGEVTSVPAQPL
jgi:hypothetical protein